MITKSTTKPVAYHAVKWAVTGKAIGAADHLAADFIKRTRKIYGRRKASY
jgi:hypothetical protein